MAINFGVQPPQWLIDRTNRGTGWGGIAGTVLGAAGLYSQDKFSDKKEEDKLSPQEAIATARGNIQDPMFRLHREQAQNQLWGQTLQLESAYAALKQQNQEMAAWQKDMPEVVNWIRNPDAPVPAVESKTALGYITKTQ